MKYFLVGLVLLAVGVGPVAAETGSGALRQQTKEQLRQTLVQKQQEIKDAKLKAVQQFKERLRLVKDERKKQVVENVGNRLCNIQTKRVQSMQKKTETIAAVIARVKAAAGELKAQGKDTSEVDRAVANAEAKLQVAKDGVTALSTRECTISLTGTEAALGPDVKRAVAAMETEVKTVIEKLGTARGAASEAVVALAKLRGEGVPKVRK